MALTPVEVLTAIARSLVHTRSLVQSLRVVEQDETPFGKLVLTE